MVARWRTLAATLVVVAVALVGLPTGEAQPASEGGPHAPRDEAGIPERLLPHPMPAPVVPTVAFIGDSIGRDAQYYVHRQVGRTHAIDYFHAVAAGYIGYHQYRSNLMPRLRAADGPDILLVELGTGDAFWDHSARRFEGDIRRFLDAVLPHVTCVRWFDQKPTVNIAYPHVNEHRLEFNRILERVLAEPQYASRNVALVSYAAWYQRAGDRGYFLADRLHHTQAGRRELGMLAGQAAEGCNPANTSGRFWDVPDRSGAATAVDWLAQAGVAEPYGNGTYRARLGSFEMRTDRGQVAGFLWRLAGRPAAPDTTWRDIPETLRSAAGWAQANGIMRGYGDGSFRPSGFVTRAALATYLWRLVGRPTETVTAHGWIDVPPELVPAVDWAVTAGIMTSGSPTLFSANRPVTRAEVAKALYALGQVMSAVAAAADTADPTSATAPTTVVPPTTTVPSTVTPPTTLPPATLPPATIPPTVPPVVEPPPVATTHPPR